MKNFIILQSFTHLYLLYILRLCIISWKHLEHYTLCQCQEGKQKECGTTVAAATLQIKSSAVNVTHSCRNPNRNSLHRAEQAHSAGQRGND
ncbi:hypothetical protein Q5P01_008682 [Channa striata]|uniref:Uncharacterized protein n=1 Tax=Channa striata TaxID=64152 RepID=A0AA88N4J2_CHASR|nr:hypothetical protein Q5P01_008682 [Channa striata]